MHQAGTVDRRGYGGQQKGTICDARGLSLDLKHTEACFLPNSIDLLCLSHPRHKIWQFCVHVMTNYITPLHMEIGNNS